MTIEELKKGYVNEVNYKKKMLKNLKSWFNLFFMISTIGVVLIYYYHAKTLWLFITGIVLFVLGALGMSIFGYGQWKGRQNLNLLIDDYQQKVTFFTKNVESK